MINMDNNTKRTYKQCDGDCPFKYIIGILCTLEILYKSIKI